jgi:AraC family transcriptional regulator
MTGIIERMTASDVEQVLLAAEQRAAALAARDREVLRTLMHPSLQWTTFKGDVLSCEQYIVGNTGGGGLVWTLAAMSSSDEGPPLSWQYARLPPHDGESRTRPGQVGVAFSAHESVSYRAGTVHGTASYPGGSVVCSGAKPIVWSRVREPTESLEIYPGPQLLTAVTGADAWPLEHPVIGRQDPVVVGIASILRRVHVTDGYLPDVTRSVLAHRLVAHVVTEYAGRPLADPPPRRHTRLSARHLDVVGDFIEAELTREITLERLAATVHLSPFHFARAFRETVGMPPTSTSSLGGWTVPGNGC